MTSRKNETPEQAERRRERHRLECQRSREKMKRLEPSKKDQAPRPQLTAAEKLERRREQNRIKSLKSWRRQSAEQAERCQETRRIYRQKKRELETGEEAACRREKCRIRYEKRRQRRLEADPIPYNPGEGQIGILAQAELRRQAGDRLRGPQANLAAQQLQTFEQEECGSEQALNTQGDGDSEEERSFHDSLKRVIARAKKNLAEEEENQDSVKDVVKKDLTLAAAALGVKQEPADPDVDAFESMVSTLSPSVDCRAADAKHYKFGSYVGQLASLVPAELRESCMKTVANVLYSFMALRIPVLTNRSTPQVQLVSNKCRQDVDVFKGSILPDS